MEREPDNNGVAEIEWLPVPPDLGDGGMAGPIPVRRAELWALVLESRYIPSRLDRHGVGRSLMVPADRLRDAVDELRLFEEENRGWPPPPPEPRPLVDNTLITLSVLLLLATFHNITQLHMPLFGHPPIDWLDLGSADAARIRNGEWWRTVTALTLHAGAVHLLGNLVIGGCFIVLLCRELGTGLAWVLLLLSGILGNLANALVQSLPHDSIGASTLVFGAVGLLGALRLAGVRRGRRGNRLLPVAGALALLAMLGTEGENTDLGAHLFGFAFGVVLGLAAEYLVEMRGRPGGTVNALLSVVAALTPVAAWWLALSRGG